MKRSEGNSSAQKITITVENVSKSEGTLMHYEGYPSNCFFPDLLHIIRLSR